MLKLSKSDTTASARSNTKGTVYPPLLDMSEEHKVAINDAPIRLKFVILKFVGKYFGP